MDKFEIERNIVDNDELLLFLKEIFLLDADETLDRINKKDYLGKIIEVAGPSNKSI